MYHEKSVFDKRFQEKSMKWFCKACILCLLLIGFIGCHQIPEPLQLSDWLAHYDSTMQFRINQYADNEKLHDYIVKYENEDIISVQTPTSLWRIQLSIKAVPHRKNAIDISAEFELVEGHLEQASVSLDLLFSAWSVDNYVIMPGAVYDGNRFASRKISYSPKLLDPLDIGPDKPPFINDIPRLNIQKGLSRIQQLAGDLATPAIGFYHPDRQFACWLLTEQSTEKSDSGLDIEESPDRTEAKITITAPGVREKVRYTLCSMDASPSECGADFSTGENVCINIRLFLMPAKSITDLFAQFLKIRKDVTGSVKHRNTVPFSACFTVQEDKYNRQNWVDEFGYYSVGMRENFLQDWQMGWTGGMINTFPLLFAGNNKSQDRVKKNFDFVFPDGIAPSGLFWDAGEKGQWYGGDIRKPHTKNWHLIRKSGDGLFYVIKQIMLMEQQQYQEQPIDQTWLDGIQTVADALVRLWDTHHQFGQFVDSYTGEVIVGGSTSGGIIPAGLALAATYFNNKDYLRVAKESASYYYKQFVRKGRTMGGPGDALQAPDSESCYGLLISYVTLFETTGHRQWLDYAQDVAHLFSTWVVSYDFEFPETSLFGRLDIQSTGAVYANAQNKHAAPGICTYSGVELLKLYRATGNELYLELIYDIAHNIPQYLSLENRRIGKMPAGWMGERVNMSDWLEGVGEIVYHSTWAEISNMLTFVEIPGLYVLPDQEKICAFDHIQAEIIASSGKSIQVQVHNPTPYAASVRCLAENRSDLNKPLGQNPLYHGQIIELESKESKIIEFLK